jgi:hypothetical protein
MGSIVCWGVMSGCLALAGEPLWVGREPCGQRVCERDDDHRVDARRRSER